ncbi:uracil-DNA glycosylase [Clostridium arbusti]|uniref:uracil-DNA glycosylase n=1 Tax=Clostridium arbusti TaxID=1137848 RepID=UPI0002892F06|nr:uracil-DNA glycosylase [Clostridium arbusti]
MTLEDLEIKIKNISENYKAEPIGGWITGDGPVPCDILFVGEAPGKTEVETGKPFVGLAGKTFEKYLNSVGLYRKNVRITNTCFFRPVKLKISKANKTTISNRPPKIPEINLFREILNEEIKIVNPKLIITLGNIPLKRLTDFKSIGECHGKVVFNSIIGKYIFPMYHPSSLTYNRNDEFLRLYENDWSLLKNLLKTI